MTVYVEYVLIDNFIISYLLLKSVILITKKPFFKTRVILVSLLSAALSLVFPLLDGIYVLSIFFKIVEGLLLVLLCTSYKGFKDYAIFYLLFLTFTFLTGGAITGIFSIFKIDASSEICTAIIFLPAYIVIKFLSSIVRFLYRRKNYVNLLFNLELKAGEKKVKAVGFLDTGNGLYHKNSPVIIADKKTVVSLFGFDFLKRAEKLTAHSVGGEFSLTVFLVDVLKVYFKDEPSIFNNVWVAISNARESLEYSVILHPDLMEETENDRFIKDIKKSS